MIHNFRRYATKINSDRIYSAAQRMAVSEYFTDLNDSDLPSLSHDEQLFIIEKWRGIIKNPECGFHSFKVFKMFDKFDANYVPEPYFYPYIIRSLNPTQDYQSLTHKCLIDTIFPDIAHPYTLVRKMGGVIC